MYTGTYAFAGVTVQIESIYPGIHVMCEAYRSNAQPEFTVHIQPSDLATEQIKSEREAALEGLPIVRHGVNHLETLAVYRKIAEVMLMQKGILLFHGSAIAADGRAVLFTAKSGTGKSTHTALWRDMLGERCFMVNDDKPLLRISETVTEVCGTPWNGKHNLGTNCIVPLQAICILERGENNEITQISASEALPMLLQQSFRPENPQGKIRLLQCLDKLSRNVKFYRLKCNMDPEAARVSYEAMLG